MLDTIRGKVEMNPLTERTIKVFHKQLAGGRITQRDECVILGTYLFNALFNGEILQEFRQKLQRLEPEELLRVVLEFKRDARELAQLPWEYIYNAVDDF